MDIIDFTFIDYLDNSELSQSTIKNHKRNYEKIKKLIDYDEKKINQDDIIILLKNNENLSQRLTLACCCTKLIKCIDKPTDLLNEYILFINKELKNKYIDRNKNKKYDYTKKDILKEMDNFYKNKNYKSFVVSYLVYKFNTRNADVNCCICINKKCSNQNENNLILRKNSILYERNVFKTKDTYGRKSHEIKNKKLLHSLKEMIGEGQKIKIFDNFNNSTHLISKHLPFNLKSSDILKIVLSECNTLHKASKIGKNRGTDLQTLEDNYNIII